ncbi:MAG TPA: hypothetical protein VFP72_16855 [Kineosporiaceae bacterium]|nr:hypothetical protein [Kineosporiaceae bacterium]
MSGIRVPGGKGMIVGRHVSPAPPDTGPAPATGGGLPARHRTGRGRHRAEPTDPGTATECLPTLPPQPAQGQLPPSPSPSPHELDAVARSAEPPSPSPQSPSRQAPTHPAPLRAATGPRRRSSTVRPVIVVKPPAIEAHPEPGLPVCLAALATTSSAAVALAVVDPEPDPVAEPRPRTGGRPTLVAVPDEPEPATDDEPDLPPLPVRQREALHRIPAPTRPLEQPDLDILQRVLAALRRL